MLPEQQGYAFLFVQGPTLLQLLQPSTAGSHFEKIHFSSHLFSQPPQDWDVPAVQMRVENVNPCQIETFLLVTVLVRQFSLQFTSYCIKTLAQLSLLPC